MISSQELGQRLKIAREARCLTQEEAGRRIGLSRGAILQLEAGKRSVSTIELMNLSRLYGKDITSFLGDQTIEKDALSALFRANPDLAENESVSDHLRNATELYREYNSLKQLLGLTEEQPVPPAYTCVDPRNVWEAIQMGEGIAAEERNRLELGIVAVRDMAEVIEAQGIPVIEVELSDQISGIFMAEDEARPCIFINKEHIHKAKARAAFTIAHEYGHVLLDREKTGTISKTTNARDLQEVRANAFAAAFLMPEEGVRQFLRSIGKGEPSREKLLAYAEQAEPVIGLHRRMASSQVITLYDVIKIYTYFGASFETALYRLKNLRFLSDEAFDQLYQRKEEARQISNYLKMGVEEKKQHISNFDLNFLGMAIEAYRRDQITYNKLLKVAGMVHIGTGVVDQVLSLMNIEESPEDEVYCPE